MKSKKILIIDQQEEWRLRFAEMLETSGYGVETLDTYDYPVDEIQPDQKPDLVVLSCSHISREEVEFVERMLAQNLHLVVLSTSLPWHDMRRVFLAGADDVTDKPYTPVHLVNVIESALQSVKCVDSYQAVKELGKEKIPHETFKTHLSR